MLFDTILVTAFHDYLATAKASCLQTHLVFMSATDSQLTTVAQLMKTLFLNSSGIGDGYCNWIDHCFPDLIF